MYFLILLLLLETSHCLPDLLLPNQIYQNTVYLLYSSLLHVKVYSKALVNKFNKKYLILNRINLLSYITTNIDNIIHLVVESDTKYYLKSLTYYGAIRKDQSELC